MSEESRECRCVNKGTLCFNLNPMVNMIEVLFNPCMLCAVMQGKEQISDVSTSDSEGITSRMSLEPVKQVM